MLQDPINNSALALKGYPVKILAYYYYYYYWWDFQMDNEQNYMSYLLGDEKWLQ